MLKNAQKPYPSDEVFRMLFGTTPDTLQPTCVMVPYLSKEIINGLHIKNMRTGMLYSIGDTENASVIVARIGAPFVGDAVLHLKKTPCKNIIFFGSCGAVAQTDTLTQGSVVVVVNAQCQDSFTGMLRKNAVQDTFYPDKTLLNDILPHTRQRNLVNARCLSVGSLKLEEEYLKTLKKDSVDVVDMETSAFFAAAGAVNIKAAAILYVTDIIKDFPFYVAFQKQNLPVIKTVISSAAIALSEILKNLATC